MCDSRQLDAIIFHHIRVHRPRSRSPTHRTIAPISPIRQTPMSPSESQCVRVRCAIRVPTPRIHEREPNRHSLNDIQSPCENDVMIVVSETPACQHQKTLPIQPRSPSRFTMLYLLHLVHLVILVRGVTQIELVVRGIPGLYHTGVELLWIWMMLGVLAV